MAGIAPGLESGSFLTISPRSFRQHTLRSGKGRPPTPSLRSPALTVPWLQPTAETMSQTISEENRSTH
jgi:hypothetical protein